MKYPYAPGSYLADARAIAPPPAPGPTHRVLELATEVEPRYMPEALRNLRAELWSLDGWTRCCRALAEEIATGALVESYTLRFRIAALGGYATPQRVRLWRPYIRPMLIFDFRVMLGLTTYLTCERCGRGQLRPTQAGQPYAHNRPEGGKCS